jgi:hypothetical protein
VRNVFAPVDRRGVTWMMKTGLLIAAIVVTSTFPFAGCAEQSTATTSTPDPSRSTYSQDDLTRTGRTDASSALRAAAPQVTTRGGM